MADVEAELPHIVTEDEPSPVVILGLVLVLSQFEGTAYKPKWGTRLCSAKLNPPENMAASDLVMDGQLEEVA